MEKCDKFAAGPVKRLLVYQPNAGSRGLLKLGLDIIGAEGDVVDAAGRVLLKEFRNRAFGVGRLKKLEVNLATIEEGGAHLLRGDLLPVLAFQSERLLEVGNRLVQRFNGDSKVIDFIDHRYFKIRAIDAS